MSNGGTGRPAATLMRALSGWTLLSLSEAQCIKWGAGTSDVPLQLPSGTESMLINAALARLYASSSDAPPSRLA